MHLEHIKQTDPIVAEQIELELKRQQETISITYIIMTIPTFK